MSDRSTSESTYGLPFWVGVAVGGAIMGYGIRLFLDATGDAHRRINFAAWLVGLDLAHDLVLVPLGLAVALGVSCVARGSWRAPVQAGAVISGAVLLVALAPLRHTAASSGNPTIQPLDYRTATLTVLAMVWVPVLGWGARRAARARR